METRGPSIIQEKTTKLIITKTESGWGWTAWSRLKKGGKIKISISLTFHIQSEWVLQVASEVGHLRPAGQVGLVEFPGGSEEDGGDQRVSLSLRLQ